MSQRFVPDRNTVTFGPAATNDKNLERELGDLDQRTASVERTTGKITTFGAPTGGGVAANEIFYGTIITFNSAGNDGTLNRTTTGETLAYTNGTGSTLQTDDVVAVTQETDTGGYIVIAIIQRASPYTPASQEYFRPTGFPVDGLTVPPGIRQLAESAAASTSLAVVPVVYDAAGALGLGAGTVVTHADILATGDPTTIVARCTTTGLNHNVGLPTGLAADDFQPNALPHLVRCGEYLVCFLGYTAVASGCAVYVWDVAGGWRTFSNGTTGPENVVAVTPATVNGNENYAVLSVYGAPGAPTYSTLNLDSLTVVASGSIPFVSSSYDNGAVAITKGQFAWSTEGFAGAVLSSGYINWSAVQRHIVYDPSRLMQGVHTQYADVHPTTGELFYVSDQGPWVITRAAFDSALSTSQVLLYDGVDPLTDPASITGVAVGSDGNVLVGVIMDGQFSGSLSTEDCWPIFLVTDFTSYVVLFGDVPYNTSTWYQLGRVFGYGVDADGTSKLIMFSGSRYNANPGVSTFPPVAGGEQWSFIDCYDA